MTRNERLPASVAIVSNADSSLYRNRAPIMLKLLESNVRGHGRGASRAFASSIKGMGVAFVPWEINRSSLNPFLEQRSLLDLMRV